MDDSLASSMPFPSAEPAGWKVAAGWTAAVLMAIVFLVAGLWKITDAPAAAVRMAQAKVPQDLALFTAISFGIAETVAAVMLLVPRWRRWGAWLTSAMLVAFIAFIGYHYNSLTGEECSCFPWIKRAVGPGFFIGDGIMLALAILAGLWAKPSEGLRGAALITAAVSVFALVSYGVAAQRSSGTMAPPSIEVDGKRVSLADGKTLIYFFDPECSHCLDAARRMAKLNWGETKVIGVAVVNPQFAQGFMQTTGLKGGISPDVELLRKTFPFEATPAAVAIENGRQKELLVKFEEDEPVATLKRLDFAR